jgi:hypothetical protein
LLTALAGQPRKWAIIAGLMRADCGGNEVSRDGTDHFAVHRKWPHPVREHEWPCPVAIGFAGLVRRKLDHDRPRPARAKRAP